MFMPAGLANFLGILGVAVLPTLGIAMIIFVARELWRNRTGYYEKGKDDYSI
jgi:hypothetical protein